MWYENDYDVVKKGYPPKYIAKIPLNTPNVIDMYASPWVLYRKTRQNVIIPRQNVKNLAWIGVKTEKTRQDVVISP